MRYYGVYDVEARCKGIAGSRIKREAVSYDVQSLHLYPRNDDVENDKTKQIRARSILVRIGDGFRLGRRRRCLPLAPLL